MLKNGRVVKKEMFWCFGLGSGRVESLYTHDTLHSMSGLVTMAAKRGKDTKWRNRKGQFACGSKVAAQSALTRHSTSWCGKRVAAKKRGYGREDGDCK